MVKNVVVVCYGYDGARQEFQHAVENLIFFNVEHDANIQNMYINTEDTKVRFISDRIDYKSIMGLQIDEVVFKTDEMLLLFDNIKLYRELFLRVSREGGFPSSFTFAKLAYTKEDLQ